MVPMKAVHIKVYHCYCDMVYSQLVDGGDRLHIWRVAVIVLNHVALVVSLLGCSSSLWVG